MQTLHLNIIFHVEVELTTCSFDPEIYGLEAFACVRWFFFWDSRISEWIAILMAMAMMNWDQAAEVFPETLGHL